MTWADDRVVDLEAENIHLKDKLESLRRQNGKLKRALAGAPQEMFGAPDFEMRWLKWFRGIRTEAMK